MLWMFTAVELKQCCSESKSGILLAAVAISEVHRVVHLDLHQLFIQPYPATAQLSTDTEVQEVEAAALNLLLGNILPLLSFETSCLKRD